MKYLAPLLLFALPVAAQCPPGGCHPGWYVVPVYQPAPVRVADRPPPCPKCGPACQCGPGCTCDTTSWAANCQAATLRPKAKAAPKAAVREEADPPPVNFGVDLSRVRADGEERYTLGGKDCNRREALSAIEAAGDIPNDSALPRLTVIGSDAARKAVLDDLKGAPALAWLKDRVVVKAYPADNWRVQDGGFVTPKPGDAVVYVQKPDGTVLWRQDSYTGPERLAGALRDKVPGYDPNKDPQPQPAPVPGPDPLKPAVPSLKLNVWWLAPVAVVLFLMLRRRA